MRNLKGFARVWRHAFRGALRGKRGLILLLLSVLPVAISWLHVIEGGANVSLSTFVAVALGVHQAVVPFAALFLGVAVLGDEIEGRTITYLFTRPLPRPVFYVGRLLGSASAFALLLAAALVASALILRSAVEIPFHVVVGTLGIAMAGFLAYASLFAVLRAVIKRALFVGFLLGFIVEGVVSKLPASSLSRCSVWHHTALLQTRLADRVPRDFAELLQGLDPAETVGGSLWVLAGIFLVSLLAGVWIVQTREIRVPAAVA